MLSLPAQQPRQILARAVAAYTGASTISASFDQTVTNPLTSRSMSSHGELLRKRPNLLSISFSTSDRIVADGHYVWVYLPSSAPGQVIRLPMSDESGVFVDPLGQILSAPIDSYDVSDAGAAVIDGHATHGVTLVPKSSRALFTKATLWVDDADAIVRQLDTTEPSGIARKVTVTRFRTDVPIPSSSFDFVPPPNTRVVDGSGMVAN